MSTALIPTSPGGTERFANPLQQIKGAFAQPAVRRSLPMALMVGLIAAAALCSREPVATRNISDFERFIPYGLQLERIPTVSEIP